MLQPDLTEILGRWHQWRAAYSPERKYARADFMRGDAQADDLDFENETMAAVDREISLLPAETQLALQHVGRAECLGVEVLIPYRLPPGREARDAAVSRALAQLHVVLLRAGLV